MVSVNTMSPAALYNANLYKDQKMSKKEFDCLHTETITVGKFER